MRRCVEHGEVDVVLLLLGVGGGDGRLGLKGWAGGFENAYIRWLLDERASTTVGRAEQGVSNRYNSDGCNN